jgi:hypothetical protein
LDDFVAAIEENYFENLLLQVTERVDKVFVNLLGRGDELTAFKSFPQKLAGDFMHQFQTKCILRPNSRNLSELILRSLQHPSKTLESAESFTGDMFAVSSRSSQGKEKFYSFLIS